jgi:hypothetical protein
MRGIALALAILAVFYYRPDDSFGHYEIIIPADFPVQYRAWVVFSEVFRNGEFVPPHVRILDVEFKPKYGILILDLSQEVLDYGGTYFEYRFINLLLKNAAALPDVRYFTVLIEGQSRHLPEGSKIYLEFFTCSYSK